jgi:hypothetical protein
MMRVLLDWNAYMFGDNQNMIVIGTIPHFSQNRHHNALGYHHVGEAIVSDEIWFFHMSPVEPLIQPAAILTKFLLHCFFWPLLIKTFLFLAWETFTKFKRVNLIKYRRGECQPNKKLGFFNFSQPASRPTWIWNFFSR